MTTIKKKSLQKANKKERVANGVSNLKKWMEKSRASPWSSERKAETVHGINFINIRYMIKKIKALEACSVYKAAMDLVTSVFKTSAVTAENTTAMKKKAKEIAVRETEKILATSVDKMLAEAKYLSEEPSTTNDSVPRACRESLLCYFPSSKVANRMYGMFDFWRERNQQLFNGWDDSPWKIRKYIQNIISMGWRKRHIPKRNIKEVKTYYELVLTDGNSLFVDGYYDDYRLTCVKVMEDPNVVRVSENANCNTTNLNIEKDEQQSN